jgi:hypothetical protein
MEGKMIMLGLLIISAGIFLTFSGYIEEPEITTTTPTVTPTHTPTPSPSSMSSSTPAATLTPTSSPTHTPMPSPSSMSSSTPAATLTPTSRPLLATTPAKASIGYGNFQLLISDAPADIADFESLWVTFSQAKVFKDGENDSKVEFRVLDLNSSKADLRELVDEKALQILNTTLEAGNYTRIELYTEAVEAVLEDNDTAEVRIPSEKLKIAKPFEVKTSETTKFVFDINVVRKGHSNEYNLLPVISKSGVVGREISEDELFVF